MLEVREVFPVVWLHEPTMSREEQLATILLRLLRTLRFFEHTQVCCKIGWTFCALCLKLQQELATEDALIAGFPLSLRATGSYDHRYVRTVVDTDLQCHYETWTLMHKSVNRWCQERKSLLHEAQSQVQLVSCVEYVTFAPQKTVQRLCVHPAQDPRGEA